MSPVERSSGGGGSFTSPLTTKGDIYGHSTVDARIPVGSDTQVLTADSTQALGVKWATPSAGGTPLAVAQYGPAALATYNVTAAALAALDTANLTIAFTVPASGNVLLRATVFGQSGVGTLGLGLLNHTGGAQIGKTLSNVLSVSNVTQIIAPAWYLTGLTPGALQIDLAAGESGGTAHVYAQGATGAVSSGNVGPAVLEAWAN